MSDSTENSTYHDHGIIIIANRPKQFESAANFLSRRGHPCSVVADIKQAFKKISELKPAFIFLSWNLRSANTLKTFLLLNKTFKSTVIVFAEQTDSKTAAELAASQLPETMQAPVSGPGIYMKIQRIIKAREEAAATVGGSGTSSPAGHSSEAESISIEATAADVPSEGSWERAGKDRKSGKTIWKFSADENKTHKGKKGFYTFKGEKPPEKSKSGKWETQESNEFTFEAQGEPTRSFRSADEAFSKLSEKELEELANQAIDGRAPVAPIEEDDEGSEFGSVMKLGGKKPKEGDVIDQTQKGSQAPGFSLTQTGPSANAHNIIQEGTKPKDFNVTQTGSEQNRYDVVAPGTNTKREDKVLALTQEPRVSGRNFESLLAKSTLKALEDSCQSKSGEQVAQITEVQNVAVMIINSTRFQGYLVATSSEQQSVSAEVLEKIKNNVYKYMKDSGETLFNFEQFEMSLSKVDFKDWSDQSAEFLAMADHKTEQWGVAFFPFEKVVPNLEKKGDNMVAVELFDVMPEAQLPFDLYIYLPVNSRYFLYCKKNQYISENQRQKMSSSNVQKFFIKESDISNFKAFCVNNKLNASISKAATKTAAAS